MGFETPSQVANSVHRESIVVKGSVEEITAMKGIVVKSTAAKDTVRGSIVESTMKVETEENIVMDIREANIEEVVDTKKTAACTDGFRTWVSGFGKSRWLRRFLVGLCSNPGGLLSSLVITVCSTVSAFSACKLVA